MEGKAHKGRVKLILAGQPGDVDIFHPVIEDDMVGDTAKVFKGMDMAIKKKDVATVLSATQMTLSLWGSV